MPPQSLKELVAYLGERPWVTLQMQELPPSRRRFVEFRDGSLWWEDEHGRRLHSPLSCKHTGDETGLRFTEAGFVIEKFGVEMVFTYITPEAV